MVYFTMNILKIIVSIILIIGIIICSYIMVNALLINMYHDVLIMFMFTLILIGFLLSMILSLRKIKNKGEK